MNNKKKYIHIIGHTRSGSTYLLDLFTARRSSQRRWNEPFTSTDDGQIILDLTYEGLIKRMKRDKGAVIKSLIWQIVDIQRVGKWWDLLLSINWYVVGLIRLDVFETTLSQSIARGTGYKFAHGFSHLQKGFKLKYEMYIPPDFFLKNLKSMLEQYKQLLEHKEHFDQIIFYEDLTGNITIDKKLIPDLKPNTLLRVATSTKMPSKQKSITNYNALRKTYLKAITPQNLKHFTEPGSKRHINFSKFKWNGDILDKDQFFTNKTR